MTVSSYSAILQKIKARSTTFPQSDRINGLELDRFDYNGKIRIGDHISKIREMDLYCD